MNLFSNNADFYPTPADVIERMMMDEDFYGKVILEPSAGSGNIVGWLQKHGAAEVIACEKDSHLRKLLSGKCRIIADDFLSVTSEDISHVHYIVMNPPFSEGAKHIIHAYEIAPPGCTVVALCNSSNLSNYYSSRNKELAELVELHGQSQNLGDVFSKAERKTNVDVALVKLYKEGEGESEFANYFFSQVDEDAANLNHKEGLMQYNIIRELVNRYVSACKMFDEVLAATERINAAAEYEDYSQETDDEGNVKTVKNHYGYLPIRFKAVDMSDKAQVVNHAVYKKELQKYYWRIIFRKLNMEKYATKDLKEQINKFIEQQTNVPFTMGNVYRVIDMVVQTSGQRMQKALLEAFDRICSFSAENSTAGEKWKTNANYMVNRRFIVPYVCQGYYWCSKDSYPMLNFDSYSRREEIEDVVKALCFLTGRRYEEIEELRTHEGKEYWGEWFEWGFFRCKGYKKGTMHFEFLDEDVWYKFNVEVSKLRGWILPKKTEKPKKTKKKEGETSLFK